MQVNCVKTVYNYVKKGWMLIVKNFELVNKNFTYSFFKRVLKCFAQLFLTIKRLKSSLLLLSFALFPHTSTNTTIYIKEV